MGVWTQDRLLKDRFDRGRLDMEYILEMKDIHKSFGPVKVLEGIDFLKSWAAYTARPQVRCS